MNAEEKDVPRPTMGIRSPWLRLIVEKQLIPCKVEQATKTGFMVM